MTFGQRLKDARKRAKLRQEDVANALGIHFTTISKWENDQADPGRENVIRLAQLYETDVSYLIEGTTPASQTENNLDNRVLDSERLMAFYGKLLKAGLEPDQIETVFGIIRSEDFFERAERGSKHMQIPMDNLPTDGYTFTWKGRPLPEKDINALVGLLRVIYDNVKPQR